jgi:hypothetical protein
MLAAGAVPVNVTSVYDGGVPVDCGLAWIGAMCVLSVATQNGAAPNPPLCPLPTENLAVQVREDMGSEGAGPSLHDHDRGCLTLRAFRRVSTTNDCVTRLP